MQATFEVQFERSVKHSHLYKGKELSGIYLPKKAFGESIPAQKLFITVTDYRPHETAGTPDLLGGRSVVSDH